MEELPYLVTFAHVVHAGSFSAGAERLGIAPSVASKHVAKLERQLGARLLQRSTRKLSLTEAGAAYYEHCARIVEELEQSREAVARLQASGMRVSLFLDADPGAVTVRRLLDVVFHGADVPENLERSLPRAERGAEFCLRRLVLRTDGEQERVIVMIRHDAAGHANAITDNPRQRSVHSPSGNQVEHCVRQITGALDGLTAEQVGRIHVAEALSYRRQAPRN